MDTGNARGPEGLSDALGNSVPWERLTDRGAPTDAPTPNPRPRGYTGRATDEVPSVTGDTMSEDKRLAAQASTSTRTLKDVTASRTARSATDQERGEPTSTPLPRKDTRGRTLTKGP